MRILTRLPHDLLVELRALDPARDAPSPPIPLRHEICHTAQAGGVAVRPHDPDRATSTRRRRFAALATVVAVIAIVGAVVATNDHSNRRPAGTTAGATPSSLSSPSTGSPTLNRVLTSAAAQAAANKWSAFPVSADPRPVVLIGDAIADPATGFPNADTRVAYETGRFRLIASLPSYPPTRDGYSLISAGTAVQQMLAMKLCCATTTITVDITDVRLVDHPFVTDRGEKMLPAWQLRLRGVKDDAFVLAVSPNQRYPVNTQTGLVGGGQIAQSPDGRTLTIYFGGPFNSLAVAQTPAAVAIIVTTQVGTSGRGGTPCAACPAIVPPGSYGPLYPGAPNTTTITLDQPLGHRVVVNASAIPVEVITN
jgi:hypothetical protein